MFNKLEQKVKISEFNDLEFIKAAISDATNLKEKDVIILNKNVELEPVFSNGIEYVRIITVDSKNNPKMFSLGSLYRVITLYASEKSNEDLTDKNVILKKLGTKKCSGTFVDELLLKSRLSLSDKQKIVENKQKDDPDFEISNVPDYNLWTGFKKLCEAEIKFRVTKVENVSSLFIKNKGDEELEERTLTESNIYTLDLVK